jgi:hypothetical protein
MPFVHSVFTFRKPSDTTELNDVLQRLEALPGLAVSGEPMARNYLDDLKVGEEVSVSLVSPTGKAARVHSALITGIIAAAGEAVDVSSSVIVEPEQKPEAGATAKSMMSRVQSWGRANRVGNQRAVPFEISSLRDISELKQGGVLFTTISSLAARSDETTAWLNSQAASVVIFDEATVSKTEEIQTQPSGPKF